MKHTQGPWTVCGLNIGSENNKVVASCYKDSLDSVVVRPETDNECLANARLIASAPDMLQELKGIAVYLQTLESSGVESATANLNSCIRAISKAKNGK